MHACRVKMRPYLVFQCRVQNSLLYSPALMKISCLLLCFFGKGWCCQWSSDASCLGCAVLQVMLLLLLMIKLLLEGCCIRCFCAALLMHSWCCMKASCSCLQVDCIYDSCFSVFPHVYPPSQIKYTYRPRTSKHAAPWILTITESLTYNLVTTGQSKRFHHKTCVNLPSSKHKQVCDERLSAVWQAQWDTSSCIIDWVVKKWKEFPAHTFWYLWSLEKSDKHTSLSCLCSVEWAANVVVTSTMKSQAKKWLPKDNHQILTICRLFLCNHCTCSPWYPITAASNLLVVNQRFLTTDSKMQSLLLPT